MANMNFKEFEKRSSEFLQKIKSNSLIDNGGKEIVLKSIDDFHKIMKGIKTAKQFDAYFKNKNKWLEVIETKSGKIKFTDISKTYTLISKNGSVNAAGKELADAAELATIKSIELRAKNKSIDLPEDTGQKFFVDNDISHFNGWKNTFVKTPIAVEKVMAGASSLANFEIVHDGSKHIFTEAIARYTKKIKINPNTWNPADVWIVEKKSIKSIIAKFDDVTNNNKLSKKEQVAIINGFTLEMYKAKKLYPISLKKITATNAAIEYTNDGVGLPSYNFVFNNNMPSDFSRKSNGEWKTHEIGGFTFKNKETQKVLRFQVKGYPDTSFGTAQTEITSDGSKTGGRLGKVPTSIIDSIMSDYHFGRVKSKSYFEDFRMSSTLKSKIKDWINMYKTINGSNDKYFEENINDWITLTKTDDKFKRLLSYKIQGMFFSYFFVKNKSDISTILTRFVLGAKKISTDGNFFVKIS